LGLQYFYEKGDPFLFWYFIINLVFSRDLTRLSEKRYTYLHKTIITYKAFCSHIPTTAGSSPGERIKATKVYLGAVHDPELSDDYNHSNSFSLLLIPL
jgi:hypothetical protein